MQVEVAESAYMASKRAFGASYDHPTAAGSDLGTLGRSWPDSWLPIDASKAHAKLSRPSIFSLFRSRCQLTMSLWHSRHSRRQGVDSAWLTSADRGAVASLEFQWLWAVLRRACRGVLCQEVGAGAMRVFPHPLPSRQELKTISPAAAPRMVSALRACATSQSAQAEPGHAAMYWQLVVLFAYCFAALLSHAAPLQGRECDAHSLHQLLSLSRSVCLLTRVTQRPRWSGGAPRRNSDRSLPVLPHEHIAQRHCSYSNGGADARGLHGSAADAACKHSENAVLVLNCRIAAWRRGSWQRDALGCSRV